MSRYFTRARADSETWYGEWDEDQIGCDPTIEVCEDDEPSRFTGLLNVKGEPIYATDRGPMGFDTSPPNPPEET